MYRLHIRARWYLPGPADPDNLEPHEMRTTLLFPSHEEALAEAERLARGYRRLYPGAEEYPYPGGRYLAGGYRYLVLEVEETT